MISTYHPVNKILQKYYQASKYKDTLYYKKWGVFRQQFSYPTVYYLITVDTNRHTTNIIIFVKKSIHLIFEKLYKTTITPVYFNNPH